MSREMQADIAWWRRFLCGWNGASLLFDQHWTEDSTLNVHSDACNDGFGAYHGIAWICGHWSPAQLAAAQRSSRYSMPFLEMLALVIAAATWGHAWTGKRIVFNCDCMSVVAAIQKRRSKQPDLDHLTRVLVTVAANYAFDLRARHIPGRTNKIADILSRQGDSADFRRAMPNADRAPTRAADVPLPPAPGQAGNDLPWMHDLLPALRAQRPSSSPPPPSL